MRNLVGPLSLVILFLAPGCFTATGPISPEGGETSPAVGWIKTVVDARHPAAEPSVAVGPDGTIIACGPRAILGGSDVWISRDAGESFQYVGTPIASPPLQAMPVLRSGGGDLGGGDCDVGADAGGRLYMADAWVGGVSVLSSTDRGATWRGVPLSITGAPLDRPWVLGGDKDEVFVTAAQLQGIGLEELGLNTPPVGGIWVARSTDGGLTFQSVLAVGNENRIGANSNLAGKGDHLFLMYTKKLAEGKLGIMVAASSDRGKTWQQHQAAEQDFSPRQCLSPLNIFPSIATDGAGGVYLAWALQNPKTQRVDLFTAASADLGVTWSQPFLVTDRPGTRAFPWIESQGPGRVGLVWYETNVTVLRQSQGTGCAQDTPNDAAWFVHFASSSNALSAVPAFSETLVQENATHLGLLGNPYAEVLQVRPTPDGRLVTAYIADVPEGQARLVFAAQMAVS